MTQGSFINSLNQNNMNPGLAGRTAYADPYMNVGNVNTQNQAVIPGYTGTTIPRYPGTVTPDMTTLNQMTPTQAQQVGQAGFEFNTAGQLGRVDPQSGSLQGFNQQAPGMSNWQKFNMGAGGLAALGGLVMGYQGMQDQKRNNRTMRQAANEEMSRAREEQQAKRDARSSLAAAYA